MSEVAVGYISLVPKFGGGFKQAIAGQIGEAGVAGGQTAGAGFRSTFLGVLAGNVMTSAIKSIGSTIKGAFGGGFDRLMNIEQAEIKLKTLGLDVKAAMSSVDEAVTGTKFAISDAADMAAFLGASGVDAGSEMTKWLSRTADAAQFTNRPFADMQALIGEVVASGRITGETLNRLPLAAAALADQLGVSQQEVRKLASQGKISAEEFGAAMDAKIGGAAKNAGESFMSLRDNMKTALNATMAALIEPFTKAAMPLMTVGLDLLKLFRDKVAKPLGASLTEWLVPAAEKLATVLSDLPGFFASMGGAASGSLAGVTRILGSLIAGVRAFASAWSSADKGFSKSGFIGAMQRLGQAVHGYFNDAMGAVDVFVSAWKSADDKVTNSGFLGVVERVGSGLRGAFDGAKAAVSGFVEGFGGFDSIIDTFSSILPLVMGPLGVLRGALAEVFAGGSGIDFGHLGKTVGSALKPVAELAAQLASMLSGVLAESIAGILPLILDLGEQFFGLVGELATGLIPVVSQVAATLLPLLMSVIGSLVPVVMSLVQTLVPLVSQFVEMLAPVLLDLITALLPPLISNLEIFIGAVLSVVEALMPLVEVLLSALIPVVMTIVQAILPPLLGIFAEVAGLLVAIVVPAITMVVEIIAQTLMPIIQALLPVVTAVFEAVAKIIGGVMKVVQGIIKTVTGIIKGDWSQAWNGIKTIFSGVWDTIKSILSGAVNVMRSIVTGLWNAVKGMFTAGIQNAISIVSRLPGGIGNALAGLLKMGLNAGKALLSGLTDGIKSMFSRPVEAVKNGLNKIRNLLPFSPAKEGPFSGTGYTSYSGQALMRDFAKGISSQQSNLQSTMRGVLESASGELDVGLSATAHGTGVEGGKGLLGQLVGPLVNVENLQVRDESDIRKISQLLQRLIDEQLRALGRKTAGVF